VKRRVIIKKRKGRKNNARKRKTLPECLGTYSRDRPITDTEEICHPEGHIMFVVTETYSDPHAEIKLEKIKI
jgi:hypothetical protein